MESASEILSILDAACESFFFPMLDNGYTYLAATRLSLFRSRSDWAMTVEVFGFSPREGHPSLAVYTFASKFHHRKPASKYVSEDAHRNYLRVHPHDECEYFYPIEKGPWIDEEFIVDEPGIELALRGRAKVLPRRSDYARIDIELEDPERIHVFELCRYLAAVAREDVLATASEQRAHVLPEMEKLLQLEEWHHPDLASDERPNELESFQQLAQLLSTGDPASYKPTTPPNTHWKNWPDGGSL
jgi:hypothetical protein